MSDRRSGTCSHEVADGVEPGDRLDAIRAATAPAVVVRAAGWWAAGGVGLVAASVVTALALSTGGAPADDGPGPAGPPSTSGTTATADGDGARRRPVPSTSWATPPTGPRLYREFRSELDRRRRGVVLALDAALPGRRARPRLPLALARRAWSSASWSSGPERDHGRPR